MPIIDAVLPGICEGCGCEPHPNLACEEFLFTRRPNALQSLYGSGNVASDRDKRRRNTAKSMISPGEREQTILTPPVVLEVVREVWPSGIALDPCHAPGSLVNARWTLDGCSDEQNGLLAPWLPRTYVNPPYKTLKLWLAKALAEAEREQSEIIVLCPVRTHRKWFREAMAAADAICWMDPLAFVGFDQAFPAPLCLMYFGVRTEAFKEACKKLSK